MISADQVNLAVSEQSNHNKMSSNDESINHGNIEDDDDDAVKVNMVNKPVAKDDNEANDDGGDSNSNDDPYDISSMSEEEEESTIHGSPSFEHMKSNSAVMSTPPRKSSNDNENDNEPSDIPELNAAPSFPPSPFPALPPQLNSISNQSGYTNTNYNMNMNNSSNSINMSPRFKPPISPAGSNSSLGSPTARSNYASSSNTLQNQQSTNNNNMNMPRFYDSEEDGPASLVFVESGSTTLGMKESSNFIVPLSPQHSVTNNNNATTTTSSSSHQYSRFFGEKSSKVPSISLSKNNTNTTTSHPSALLPYPQRRKMAIMGEGGSTTQEENIGHSYLDNHNNGMNVSSSSLVDNKKPPTAPLSSPSTQQQQQQPMMMMNHKQSMAEKYKVPPIPVFRGSANHTANHVSNEPMNNNMHHHYHHYSSSPPDRVARASSPMDYNPHNIRPPLAHYSTNSTGGGGSSANSNTMKQQQQQRQQVINCPPPPPPASPKDSPETSSFHIRCNSQTSISSLGSNAVDSVKGGGGNNNNNPSQTMNMMYKQFPQGYGVGGYTNNAHLNTMMTPYGYNMHPHPMGYPNIQQQQQQQQPPPKSNSGVAGFDNLNALNQDIATFLHGERIAAATAQTKNNGNNNNNKGSKPTTVPKNHLYWNGYPQGVVPPMWQGPYQQQQQPPPPTPYNNNTPEPPPPPLTTVPNMELRRVRLPSISDDDWAEELEKINQEDYEDEDDLADGNRVKRQDRPNKKEWEFQMRQQQQQQQQHQNMYNSQNNPHQSAAAHNLYPNMQGYYHHHHHHHPMQQQQQHSMPYYNMPLPPEYRYRDNDPHERSKLLDNHHHSYNHNDYRSSKLHRDESEQRRTTRKKKKSRRRDKSKRQQQNTATDSTDEDVESERKTASTNRSRRSRRHRRKKRDGGGAIHAANHTLDDTLSDTLSESYMSQSLGEQYSSTSHKPIRAGFCRRIAVRTKLLVCNMPLSAGAISFSVVLLGTLWFKWAEELLSSCKEVTFHSSQCNLPDFPGCYFCDEFNHVYLTVTHFHTTCSYIGGIFAMLFLAKALLSWRSFIDEMSSPTTSSPVGLIFMTMALAFVGKGKVGEVLVILASLLHLVMVVWFIYMSLAYQTMPDPSWFANTIGIGLCAVKVWFYYPLLGHFLIAITLMLTLSYFPISLVRVAVCERMSATVSYLQMMCPAVCLYSLAIIMEPSFREERPDISHFQALQRLIYLPSLSCLFTLSIIGAISSIHGIFIRLGQISREEFSPAHAAYSFPLLLHALAVQSYRSALDFFAGNTTNPTLKSALHMYFVSLMVVGTFVSVICIIMYIAFLPQWTIVVDPSNENAPPPPEETTMIEYVTYGESLIQYYTSPTILQANETGVMIMAYSNENDDFYYIRSRRQLPALGFEPMMRTREFTRERDALKSLTNHEDVIHEVDEDKENANSETRSELGV